MLLRLASVESACVNGKLSQFLVTVLNDEENCLLVVGRLVVGVESRVQSLNHQIPLQLLLGEAVHFGQLGYIEVEGDVEAFIFSINLVRFAQIVEGHVFVLTELQELFTRRELSQLEERLGILELGDSFLLEGYELVESIINKNAIFGFISIRYV
jgi:hypothetical protein